MEKKYKYLKIVLTYFSYFSITVEICISQQQDRGASHNLP